MNRMKRSDWLGRLKRSSAMPCGWAAKDDEPSQDSVLDHIVLELTGSSVPVQHISDPHVQREFEKKRRLLRKTNTVVFSRLAIMALVAIMLIVTTLLTWYFTSSSTARSMRALATVLRTQLLRTSVQTMASVLGEVYNATMILNSLHRQVYFDLSNSSWTVVEPGLRQMNKGLYQGQTQYSSVAFVSEDGLVTDYTRSSTGAEYYFFINSTYGPDHRWYYQNISGFENDTQAPPAMVRNPPYPLSAENVLNNRPQDEYWTIAPNSLGIPVVSPAIPLKDNRTGTVYGLSTITSSFNYLNRYLRSVDLLGGYLYFEWRNATGPTAILANSYNTTSDMLANPKNASNPVVRAAANFLESRYQSHGGFANLNGTHDSDVKLLGQKYYIDTMPLVQKPFNVLNLTAVMIVPRRSIMGRIDEQSRTVIGVSVGTCLGILIVGCCVICFLTSKMSTEMRLRKELIRLLVGKHRAEQSSNYKSQFLANMSHEMRTPMAGIIGLLDLLSCDSLSSEQEYSVSQIRNCATGLLALVNNVLDISKIEAGKVELEEVPLCVADELELLTDMFAAQAVGSNFDIVLDLSDDIPYAMGDITRIRQIFTNLISNSVKFTKNGHVLIRGRVDQSLLRLSRDVSGDFSRPSYSSRERDSAPIFPGKEEKVALVFEVDDSGCGIPEDMREAVFGSFVQGDSSTTRVYGGSGLGLYIVKSLVELMGGEVTVVPKDSGTLIRFHIILEEVSSLSLEQNEHNAKRGLTFSSPPSEQDGLNSMLGSPSHPHEIVAIPSPDVMEKTQVLIAMKDGATRNVAVDWMRRNGVANVTCLDKWEEVIPTLHNLCKNFSTSKRADEIHLGDSGRMEISPRTSLHAQALEAHRQLVEAHIYSEAELRSRISENMPEALKFPPVLALVDLNLHPATKAHLESTKTLEANQIGARDRSVFLRPDLIQFPSHIQHVMDSMLRLYSQHSLAVAWIVTPDCGAKWKPALQAGGRFSVLNKPLGGRRVRRLFARLAKAETIGPQRWAWNSCQSSTPSTPRLVGSGIHSPEAERSLSAHARDGDFSFLDNLQTDQESHAHHQQLHSSDELQSGNGSAPETFGLQGSLTDTPRQNPLQGLHSPATHVEDTRNESNERENQATPLTPSEKATNLADPQVSDSKVFGNLGRNNVQEVDPQDLRDVSRNYSHDLDNVHSRGEDIEGTLSPIKPSLQLPKIRGTMEGENSRTVENWQRPDRMVNGEEGEPLVRTSSIPESPTVGLVTDPQRADFSSDEGGGQRKETERSDDGVQEIDLGLHIQQRFQEKSSVATQPSSSAENIGGRPPAHPSQRHDRDEAMRTSGRSKPGTKPGAANMSATLGSRALSSMRILLVEDTPVLQRLENMMLTKLGANVTVVGDGLQAVTAVSEAVEAAESGLFSAEPRALFDLVLMDCAMPVMDGYNATKAIRAAEENTSRHIPIVALTAHALASDEEKCLSVGMDAYLTKPINCKLMVTTIQDLVSKGRS